MEAALGRPAALLHFRTARWLAPLAIALVAILTRAAAYGNPVAVLDDQFYLLVGDALLRGQWAYIDIWDRKPVGLFLLYAGIAAIGGGSMLAMQIIATLFAAATALVIRRIAALFVAAAPALLAALAYLVMLPLLGGASGQSPVFYNLFVAGAAWLLLSAAIDPGRPLVRNSLVAMLLCGLAISVKPVAAFEGIAFGLSFLWLLWRRGTATAAIARAAAAMIALALLPVILPFLVYAVRGSEARDAFVYANFVSIFQKDGFGIKAKLAGLAFFIIYAVPLLLLAGDGVRKCWEQRRCSPAALLLLGWLAAAFVGYLAVPHFFDHYALPLLVPLCVAAGFAFSRRSGPLYAAGLLLFSLIQGSMLNVAANRRAITQFDLIVEEIDRARDGGCLYLADGPTWLYQQSRACRMTPYLFPDHLNLYVERRAIGVDPRIELARILSARPAVIITQDSEQGKHNPLTKALLDETLARNYRTVYLVPADAAPLLATLRVWQRRDLARADAGRGPQS